AGAAIAFDPVFLFDNWPHPRGVVRAHQTLATAAYYQPLFKKERATSGKPPMFVLDRRRLSTYTDDATQFDNRYVSKLPQPGSVMSRTLGAEHVLYVVPRGLDTARELDDLNDDFVAYAAAGLDVKAVATEAFYSAPTPPVDASSFERRPPPSPGKPLRGD